MRLGKLVTILLLLVGALVVPVTTAQATTTASACAPTAEGKWLGTFRGPHRWENPDGSTDVQQVDVTVVQDNGQLKIWRHGYLVWASTADGLLNTSDSHPFLRLDATSATCGSDGQVTGFSGWWYFNYYWPECWSCVVGGSFDVIRV